jgi:very-short-patch-repair endonuclease
MIAELAVRQHGLVTRAQLLGMGVPSDTVRGRVRVKRLHPVHRGVYRVGPLSSPREHEMAAVLACGAGATISHWSGAGLWQVCRPRGAADRVDVTVACADRGRRPGIRAYRVGRSLHAEEVTVLDGIPVTSLARTVFDLAGLAGPAELRQMFARAERRDASAVPANRPARATGSGVVPLASPPGASQAAAGRATGFRGALSALLERHPKRPGAPLLRALLTHDAPQALTRSEAEERVLRLIARAQLPRPEVNAWVERCEVDFVWRDERLIFEVDGFAFHGSRASFESDRHRDARLAARGFRVMRVTWRQITREPEAMLVRLGQALAVTAPA